MAASMWNDTGVSSPPIASCFYDCYEIEEVDVYNLKLALQVIQTSHWTSLGLSSEQYTLSRLVYKSNNQQRHWRWYQMLKKMEKCLNRLQANNPVKFLEDAIGCCQINHSPTGSGSVTIHLPARQMLQYILVRLMGQAKMCAYILNMAEKSFVVQNITSGQFLPHNTIYASIVSRIWVMMRAVLKDILSWYSTLRPWADKLKATCMTWMPPGEMLPQSLYDWLRPDYDPDKYANVIDQTSKKTGHSLLDSMFATASQTTTEGATSETPKSATSETPKERNHYGKDVTMAPNVAPSMDLGEPITAKELAKNRKRKQTDSGHLQEPVTKKSRCEIETWTPKVNNGRPAGGTNILHSETYMKESRLSHELEHNDDVQLGQIKKKSKGILRHLKQHLKGEEKRTEMTGNSERRTNKATGLSDRQPEERQRTWRTDLKKSLKNKFEKLCRNSSANIDERNADLKIQMVGLNPVDEDQGVEQSASVGCSEVGKKKRKGSKKVSKETKTLVTDHKKSVEQGQVGQMRRDKMDNTEGVECSEVGHYRKKLKGSRKVTKETKTLVTDNKKSMQQGQVRQMSRDKMDNTEGITNHLKLPKKCKGKREIVESEHETNDPIASPVANDTENMFTFTTCPSGTSQSKTSKKSKKKTKDGKKLKKLSSSKDRNLQICEKKSNERIDRTEGVVKHKRKQHTNERELKIRNVHENNLKQIIPTSPSKPPHQDQMKTMKTKRKAAKIKGEDTESGGFKGIFKKLKKHKSESSLVCDLGQIARTESVKSNNQGSDIDRIFAFLE